MLRFLSLALLLATALTASGCDAVTSLLGDFDGNVELAGTSATVEGDAIYTVVDGPTGPRFVLGLFVDGVTESSRDDYDYVLVRFDGGLPAVGAYAVDGRANGSDVVTATYATVEDAGRPSTARGAIVRGTDGTFIVSHVDGYGNLAGTLRFDGVGTRLEAPGTTVSGGATTRFEARYEAPAVFQRLGITL